MPNNVPDVPHTVLTGMALLNPVEVMDAGVPVVLALSAKNAAEDTAAVLPTVLVVSVEMMVAEAIHVDPARLDKPVTAEFVLGPVPEPVETECVAMIESEVLVVLALPDKDVEEESANAIMTVTIETAVMHLKKLVHFVPLRAVVAVLLASHATQTDNAQPLLLVMSPLLL